jgi:polar amino acid transport system substrate-binding protein
MKRYMLTAAIAAALSAGAANAETCGGAYSVQRGDSLSLIADTLYKNAGMWTAIQQNNIDKIGSNPNNIAVGMKLNLLCLNGLPVGLEGGVEVTEASTAAAAIIEAPVITQGTGVRVERINIVTGDDYAPFTDRKLDKGGLLTELVQRAMEESAPAEGFAIHWVNDWDSHLPTLLEQGLVDMSFPWSRPDCANLPDDYRCETFLFSESLFEILELAYYDKSRPVTFDQDSDMEGKTLCRVSGYSTHELDKNGRNWVKGGKVKLERPEKVGDCFQLLIDGKVDVVQIDEFAGKAAIKEMGLGDKVEALPRPVSVEPLNVLIHKGNPRAQEIVDILDRGLAKLKETGEYQRIAGEHLSRFWAEQ